MSVNEPIMTQDTTQRNRPVAIFEELPTLYGDIIWLTHTCVGCRASVNLGRKSGSVLLFARRVMLAVQDRRDINEILSDAKGCKEVLCIPL